MRRADLISVKIPLLLQLVVTQKNLIKVVNEVAWQVGLYQFMSPGSYIFSGAPLPRFKLCYLKKIQSCAITMAYLISKEIIFIVAINKEKNL